MDVSPLKKLRNKKARRSALLIDSATRRKSPSEGRTRLSIMFITVTQKAQLTLLTLRLRAGP